MGAGERGTHGGSGDFDRAADVQRSRRGDSTGDMHAQTHTHTYTIQHTGVWRGKHPDQFGQNKQTGRAIVIIVLHLFMSVFQFKQTNLGLSHSNRAGPKFKTGHH